MASKYEVDAGQYAHPLSPETRNTSNNGDVDFNIVERPFPMREPSGATDMSSPDMRKKSFVSDLDGVYDEDSLYGAPRIASDPGTCSYKKEGVFASVSKRPTIAVCDAKLHEKHHTYRHNDHTGHGGFAKAKMEGPHVGNDQRLKKAMKKSHSLAAPGKFNLK